MKTIQWVACNSDSPKRGLMCARLKFHTGDCVAYGEAGMILETWKTNSGNIDDNYCCPIHVDKINLEKDGVEYSKENIEKIKKMIDVNTDQINFLLNDFNYMSMKF